MPTASCIWKSFQTSGKKHLILTGDRGSGKTTLLSALFPCPMPGLTSWAVPKQGVYLKDNFSSNHLNHLRMGALSQCCGDCISVVETVF